MAIYGYQTRKELIGTIGSYVDIIATIEGPEDVEFMVECLSEKDYTIRFFETVEGATAFGKLANRKADRQDVMATYRVYNLIPMNKPKAGK
jgi:hypothetical protein